MHTPLSLILPSTRFVGARVAPREPDPGAAVGGPPGRGGVEATTAVPTGSATDRQTDVAGAAERIGSGMAGRLILCACLVLLAACTGAKPEPTRMVSSTEAGQFRISVASDPSPIPLNEPFELSVVVERTDGSPAEGLTLDVDGWMPDHGHGMLRRAAVEDLGDGQYRVRGMLMHMGGLWELRVAVAWRETSGDSFQIHRDQSAFAVEL